MTSRKQDGRKIEELLREGCHRLMLEKQNGGKVNVKEMAKPTRLNIPYSVTQRQARCPDARFMGSLCSKNKPGLQYRRLQLR